MRHNVFIFDLDGTLLDTIEDLTAATNFVLTSHHMPTHTVEDITRFVGNGVRRLLRLAVTPETTEEELDALVEEFRGYYAAHCTVYTHPYEGLMEVLRELLAQGKRLAIVSNKPDYGVKRLNDFYFAGMMEQAVGEQAGVARKPAPDSVLRVMELMGAEPSECVYVGDSDVDVATAKNAGLDCIAVAWGFCGRAALERFGADCIADQPADLLRLG